MYYDKKKELYREQITINGKRKVVSAKTKKELKFKMLSLNEAVPLSQNPTFKEVAEQWQTHVFDKMTEGTQRCYRAALERAIEHFGPLRINDITPNLVKAWLGSLELSYKTTRNHKSILSQILDYAIVDMSIIAINPCDKVKVDNKLPKGSRRALTDYEISELRNTNPEEFQLGFLILMTGTRCGEALGIQYKDIDWEQKVIHITKAIHHRGNQPYIGTLKTEKSNRDIPLLPPLEARLKIMYDGNPEEYVVSGEKPLTKSALDKRWKKYCKEHDIDIDRHSIRHAFATIMFEAGIDAKTAQIILGHAQFSTTMDIYTHVRDKQLDNAAILLSEYLA